MDQPLIAPDLTDEPVALATGDAAEASVAIESWLARRAMTEQPDWEGCLAKIRDGLTTLAGMPIIQNDPDAGAILAAMVTAEDMEQFAADMDRLATRVARLLGGTPRRTPASILNIGSLQSWNADPAHRERIEVPSRVMLRL